MPANIFIMLQDFLGLSLVNIAGLNTLNTFHQGCKKCLV